jgi:hypothetical protein
VLAWPKSGLTASQVWPDRANLARWLDLDFLLWPRSTLTHVFTMVPPPAPSLDTVASAVAGVAPAALAMAIATLQAAAAASRERAVGAVAAAGAPTGTAAGATAATRPHPLVGPPFIAVGAPASTSSSAPRTALASRSPPLLCTSDDVRLPPRSPPTSGRRSTTPSLLLVTPAAPTRWSFVVLPGSPSPWIVYNSPPLPLPRQSPVLSSVRSALVAPRWRRAMEEYEALLSNST